MKLDKKEVCVGIGKRIREIRLLQGLTLEKLAHEANMDYTQLSRIELGKINTSLYQIYQLAFYLKTPVKEFFKDLK